MKNVVDIRDEFFDNGNRISSQSMKDLIWHIENDPFPDKVISLVADARFMELVPKIAKYMDHEDDFIRELTVGCVIHRLKVPDYAKKALDMALKDPCGGPRTLATASLGAVINKVEPMLQKQIAKYLYDVITNPEYDDLDKTSAFQAILEAMEIPVPQQLTFEYDENHMIVKEFQTKYIA